MQLLHQICQTISSCFLLETSWTGGSGRGAAGCHGRRTLRLDQGSNEVLPQATCSYFLLETSLTSVCHHKVVGSHGRQAVGPGLDLEEAPLRPICRFASATS